MKTSTMLGTIFCLLVSHVAHADPTCERLFGKAWAEADDALMVGMANEFLAKVNPFMQATICYGDDARYPYAMNTLYLIFKDTGGEIPMMSIAIDSHLRARLSEKQLRAVVAHEVAHHASGEGVLCPMYDTLRDRTLCESQVDKDAARMTSKEDVISMLEYFVRPDHSPLPNSVFMEETLFRIKELREWVPE